MNRISVPRKGAKAGQRPGLLARLLLVAAVSGGAALFLFARALFFPGQSSTPFNVRDDTIKIEVAENGLYRLTLEEIREAGLDIDALDVQKLRLSSAGETRPYWIQEEALIFYGQASNSRYSKYESYLLERDKAGELMASQAAGGPDNPVAALPQLLHLEQNNLYDGRARDENSDQNESQGPWFWDTIQVQSQLPLHFDLPEVSPEPAVIRLNLWGATHDAAVENDHDFDMILNGQKLATIRWDGETRYESETMIPAGVLRAGENELVLDNGVEGAALVDIMRLDWIDTLYHIPPAAAEDSLILQDVEGRVGAAGFSGRPLVFDITNPQEPVLLEEWFFEQDRVEIPVQPGQRLIAAGPEGYLEPAALSAVRQSGWRGPENQADLLIITTGQLAPALTPLVEARRAQGIEAAVIPVEEIYDEFGFGRSSPHSITEFIRYTIENWADPKPRYLLLVGEATYDYRGFLGGTPQNMVPTLMIAVSYSGETISDSRLADIDGDFRPDLAVGRWPVDSPQAVSDLVQRTLAYENGTASGRIIFAADGTSSEFSSAADRVLVSTGLNDGSAEKLYGVTAGELTQSWNQGAWLVNYIGHGSLDRWGQQDVFSAEAVSGLQSSGPPPIVLQLTCLTGFFAHPTIASLSEEMLFHQGGPVLIVSASSLTLSSSQTPFAVNLLNELQNPEIIRMGDAVQQAKAALDISIESLREVNDTFGLLGDPTAVIVRPDALEDR